MVAVNLSVSPTTLVESQSTVLTFTFTLDQPPPADGLLVYVDSNVAQSLTQLDLGSAQTTGGGFPIGDFDFTGFAFNMTQQTATISVPIFQDDVAESPTPVTYTVKTRGQVAANDLDEIETQAGQRISDYTIGSSPVTVTLLDTPQVSKPVVSVSASQLTLVEDQGTATTITLTIEGTIPPGGLDITLDNDVAFALGDFDVLPPPPQAVITGGTLRQVNSDNSGLTIRAQQNTVTITLPIFNDDDLPAGSPGATRNDDIGDEQSTFKLVANDAYTIKPNAGQITFTLKDSVAPANRIPVAANDSYSTSAGQALTVPVADGLLKNDTDADNNPLTAKIVTQPTNGTLTLNANGSFSYTPNAGFTGTDRFTYVANDGKADSTAATATIAVNAVVPANRAPVAVNDTYTTTAGQALTVPVATGLLRNDTDADSDPLTAKIVTQPTNGTLTPNANGSFSYTPNAGFTGTDRFTYVANDGKVDSAAATAEITVSAVTPTNRAPIAVNDAYATAAGQALTVPVATGLLRNDTDADSDPLTAKIVTQPTNGTLTPNANGSFSYTPNAGFTGTDRFTYVANDGKVDSAAATAEITVSAVVPTNRPPVAVNDTYSTVAGQVLTAPVDSGVLRNDTDADNNPLTAKVLTQPSNGALVLNANGSFSYTPNAGFTGSDSFTYAANDGTVDSAAATVAIAVGAAPPPTNRAPVAANDSYSTTAGKALAIAVADGVLKNDSDADNDPLTVKVVTSSNNGTLALNADGSFSYTPNAGFTGSDSFTYVANDSKADSAAATVAIAVSAAPVDPPAPSPDQMVYGDSGDNVLRGGEGNDSIYGNGGNDTLIGNGGNDKLYGGAGGDSMEGGAGSDMLYGNGGKDTLEGGDGDDVLFGAGGTDKMRGGAGNDILYGNSGKDSLMGGAGDDKLYGGGGDNKLDGGAGNDTLYGNEGENMLSGGDGDDLIYGGSQADTIAGGAGNDVIYANGGGDIIDSGSGLDTVWLGAGAASIALNAGEGFVTVKNFQLGKTLFTGGGTGLSFADSADGVRIAKGDDLLAVVTWQNASTFSSNASTIFA
jgi:VCBS repeat-containing protein